MFFCTHRQLSKRFHTKHALRHDDGDSSCHGNITGNTLEKLSEIETTGFLDAG